MRLVAYSSEGQQRPGVIQGRLVFDIQRSFQAFSSSLQQPIPFLTSFSMLEILGAGEVALDRLLECIRYVQDHISVEDQDLLGLVHVLDGVCLEAPISNPGKLIAIGGNYPAAGKLAAPEFPVIFLKPASSISGPGKPVLVSPLAASVSYEVELAAVVGRRAHRVGEAEALNYVAGYCLANDMGDRLLEKRTSQWTTGKMFDTFTPLGPFILTRDDLPDTHDLSMETTVNGQTVQRGNTGSMFFDVKSLVSYVSHLTTLNPGDVILTGSPKLIDGETPPALALKPGDSVRVAIEGLGELVNPLEAEPE